MTTSTRRPGTCAPALRAYDLDALAGVWRKDEGATFERATAAFGKVDPKLWK